MLIGTSKSERTDPDAIRCEECIWRTRRPQGPYWRNYRLACHQHWWMPPRMWHHRCAAFLARTRDRGDEQ